MTVKGSDVHATHMIRICNFQAFEERLFYPSFSKDVSLKSLDFNDFLAQLPDTHSKWLRQGATAAAALPEPQVRRALPCSRTILSAVRTLDRTESSLPDIVKAERNCVQAARLPEKAVSDVNYQLSSMQQLIERMDAGDGEYARQILQRLDLGLIRATIDRQTRLVSRMSEAEKARRLADEVMLLFE